MTLPKLTLKQQEILDLLYIFRFLNRVQIQAFLHHKDYKTINMWLKDLREKKYVEWIYSTDFVEKTKPAIYYLSLNAIRHFTAKTRDPHEIRKRYRESSRSQTFIDRCIVLADCCITLDKQQTPTSPITYFYETEADYLEESYFHFITESDLIQPHLCFSKMTSAHDVITLDNYFLEIFDPTLPRYRMKKRLSDYVTYFEEGAWEADCPADNEPSPILLLVCPQTTDLIYAKRRVRGLLEDIWERDDEERPRIRLTTIEKLKTAGILGTIWEDT